MTRNPYRRDIASQGYRIERQAVAQSLLDRLALAIDRARSDPSGRRRRGELFGMRNLLAVPEVREFATGPTIRELVRPILGEGAMAVRGLYFDKTPAANWRRNRSRIGVVDAIDRRA